MELALIPFFIKDFLTPELNPIGSAPQMVQVSMGFEP
jgi:hypothetical protein